MKHFMAWRATARMCLKEKSYFGLANIIAQYLLRAAGLGALLMIWRSLFLQGTDMQGLTLNQVMANRLLLINRGRLAFDGSYLCLTDTAVPAPGTPLLSRYARDRGAPAP